MMGARPDSADIAYLPHADRLQAEPSPEAFVVELQVLHGSPPTWTTIDKAWLPGSLREHRFDMAEPVSGKKYRARVAAGRVEGTISAWKNSSPLTAP